MGSRDRFLVAFLLASVCACGRPQPEPVKRSLSYKSDAELMRFSTGMQAIVIRDTSAAMISVGLRYKVGAGQDPAGKAGLAHLTEHLMFAMQPAGPDKPNLQVALSQLATWSNAYTTADATHYVSFGPKKSLGFLIAAKLLLVGPDCNTISTEAFNREREVVRNEVRQRYGASGIIAQLVREEVFPPGHPYRRGVASADEQLASLTLRDACDFMRSNYQPGNATLVIVGDTSADEVTQLVAQYATGAAAASPAPRVAPPQPVRITPGSVTHRRAIARPTAVVIFAAPPRSEPRGLAAWLAFEYLDDNLRYHLRSQGYVTGVDTGWLGGARAPIGAILVTVTSEDKLKEAVDLIKDKAEDAWLRFAEHDFQSARSEAATKLLASVEPLYARGDVYADYWQFHDGKRFVLGDLNRMGKLSRQDVDTAGRALFDQIRIIQILPDPDADGEPRRADLTFVPKTHDDSEWKMKVKASEANRPLPVPPLGSAVSRSSSFQLPNGMRVFMFPSTGQPVVDLRLVFANGYSQDPIDKTGLAQWAAQLLRPDVDRGGIIDRRDARIIESARNMYRTGALIGAWAEPRAVTFRLRGLAAYIDVFLDGLALMVKEGHYDDKVLAAEQQRWQYSWTQAKTLIDHRYQVALAEAAFGPEHMLTARETSRPRSWQNISKDDLRSFKKRHFQAGNATLIVTGSFDPAAIEKHIRYVYEQWPKSDEPVPTDTAAAAKPWQPSGRFIGIDDSSTVQAHITIVIPLPDSAPTGKGERYVLRRMLEQRFAAVRREQGASYGVSVGLSELVGGDLLIAKLEVDRTRLSEALARVRQELNSLRGGDNFGTDFAIARRRVVRGLTSATTSSVSVAERLSFIAQHGVATSYYDELVESVAALRARDLKSRVYEALSDDRVSIICRARRAEIEAAFQQLGISDYRLAE